MIIADLKTYKSQNLPLPIEAALEEFLDIVLNNYSLIKESNHIQLSEKTNNAKVLIQHYTTKNEEDAFFETHEIMTDVQLVLEGEEYIYARELEGLSPLKKGTDVIFYNEKPNDYTRVHLRKGIFAIFYPSDAHAPAIKVDTNINVLKIVIKVPL